MKKTSEVFLQLSKSNHLPCCLPEGMEDKKHFDMLLHFKKSKYKPNKICIFQTDSSEITNHNNSERSSFFYLKELVNSSCFSLWSFVKIHPQKILIHISLLQMLNFQKTVTQILSSKHLIINLHLQAVFHVSKIKTGT